MASDINAVYTNVVILKMTSNFVIDKYFLIWNHLESHICFKFKF